MCWWLFFPENRFHPLNAKERENIVILCQSFFNGASILDEMIDCQIIIIEGIIASLERTCIEYEVWRLSVLCFAFLFLFSDVPYFLLLFVLPKVWDRAEEFIPERFDLEGPIPNESNSDYRSAQLLLSPLFVFYFIRRNLWVNHNKCLVDCPTSVLWVC